MIFGVKDVLQLIFQIQENLPKNAKRSLQERLDTLRLGDFVCGFLG